MHDPVLLFLHIPKTAGTTFDAILDRNFPREHVANIYPGFGYSPQEFADLPPEDTGHYALIRGHYCYGLHEGLERPHAYVTFLRSPVEQVLSRYNHARSRFHGLRWLARQGLAEFIRQSPDNYQTRMLMEPRPVLTHEHPVLTDDDLAQARANLEQFLLVGLTELFDESLLLARERLPLREIHYARHNVRRRRSRPPEPELRDALAEHCRYDRQLHDWARRRLQQQVAERGAGFAAELEEFRAANARYARRRGGIDRLTARARKARRFIESRLR